MMGKRGRAKGGMIPGRIICYGYDVDEDGYPILNKEAAETVRYIYRLYVEEGLGMIKLAKRLNSEAIPSPRGRQWKHSVVNKILSHPAYMGTWHYGTTRWEYLEKRVKKTRLPEQEHIEIRVPQIINENTWHRVQQLKRERLKRAKRNIRTFYLLQHLVYCDSCGRMIGCRTERRKTIRKNGESHRSYALFLCATITVMDISMMAISAESGFTFRQKCWRMRSGPSLSVSSETLNPNPPKSRGISAGAWVKDAARWRCGYDADAGAF